MRPVSAAKNATGNFDPQSMLGLGAKGPAVSEIQRLLNDDGAGLKVDGHLGLKTEQAVLDFQRQHGLAADGIVGPETFGTLLNGQVAHSPSSHAGSHLDLNHELASPESRLSVAIGFAEGTRKPDGARTPAYQGHKDPLKGYNVGTFSYQHPAGSPAQADEQQLQRFGRVRPEYENACRKAGLDPASPLLAGTFFDLYNQAPKAAMDQGGLLDQLPSLAKKGISLENLAQARCAAFYDPNKAAFDTNMSLPALKADQKRRTDCLAQVLGDRYAAGTEHPDNMPRPSRTTPIPAGKIGLHSEGPEVAALKQAMKNAGFYHGPVNERMGNQGLDGLKLAKAALHIGGPEDIAGAETIQHIQDSATSGPRLHVNVDFVSQFDGRVKGDYDGQKVGLKCDNSCEYVMRHSGNSANRTVPDEGDVNVHAYENGGRNDRQVQYIESQLRAGKPVMIEVNHPNGTANTRNKNGINHFLVATGIGVDEQGRQYISFNDPVQTSETAGKDTNPENRLYLQNGQFVQNRASDPYQLRGIVTNQGARI